MHKWYYKPSQYPVAGEVIGSRGKAPAVVLLNGHDVSVESPFEMACLWAYINSAVSLVKHELFFPPTPGSL